MHLVRVRFTIVLCLALSTSAYNQKPDSLFLKFITDPASLTFHWRNDTGQPFKNFLNLKNFIETHGKTLIFAMNGGMYRQDNSPQGLYIEFGEELTPLDTASGQGNFYLEPNGVFFITNKNKAIVTTTEQFTENSEIKFATQSGPSC